MVLAHDKILKKIIQILRRSMDAACQVIIVRAHQSVAEIPRIVRKHIVAHGAAKCLKIRLIIYGRSMMCCIRRDISI